VLVVWLLIAVAFSVFAPLVEKTLFGSRVRGARVAIGAGAALIDIDQSRARDVGDRSRWSISSGISTSTRSSADILGELKRAADHQSPGAWLHRQPDRPSHAG
jgi:hypothetical protein